MHEQQVRYDQELDELTVVNMYMDGSMKFESTTCTPDELVERLNRYHDNKDCNEVLTHAGFILIDIL